MKPEEHLLILASYARLDEREKEIARSLPVEDWELFWSLAEENATSPLVHYNLERLGLDLPASVKARLEASAAAVRQANEARLEVARELFRRFAERGIPVAILKGVLFAETIYRNPSYKRMNDIDILVRREDLEAVYEVYEKMRLFSAAELLGRNPRKQERFSHHAPPFFSRDLRCMIGTHWGLITPLGPYRPDYDAIWSRMEDLDFYGSPAKSMAPEDNLHHLCMHLPYYKTGVRELADIYNLVRHYPRLDWDLFDHEVEKSGTEKLVFHALSLANRLCPTVDAQEAIRRVDPRVPWYLRRDVERKTRSISLLLRSRSVHLSRIEKAYGDLNATRKPVEKWAAYGRMWKNLLWPPSQDVAKINALEQQTAFARLLAPWRIFRVLARDVGAGLFVLILAKCFVDCVLSSLSDSEDDHAAFAERLGVRLGDLERLKEALE